MEFWGLRLQSGFEYTQRVRQPFHISTATLDVRDSEKGIASVIVNINKEEYILCNLSIEHNVLQCHMDLNFSKGDQLTFELAGESKSYVHLTGYVNSGKQSRTLIYKKGENLGELADGSSNLKRKRGMSIENNNNSESLDSMRKKREKLFEERANATKQKKLKLNDSDAKNLSKEGKKLLNVEAKGGVSKGNEQQQQQRQQQQQQQQQQKQLKEKEKEEEEEVEVEEEDVEMVDEVKSDDEEDDDDDEEEDEEAEVEDEEESDDEEEEEEEEDDDDDDDIDEELEDLKKENSPVKIGIPALTSSAGRTPMVKSGKKAKQEASPELAQKLSSTSKKSKAKSENGDADTPKSKKKKSKLDKSETPTPQSETKKLVRQGGLVCEDLKVGTGAEAKNGKYVTLYYEGKLKSGKCFDKMRTGSGFKFRLGANEVIKGWDLGILGMKVGGKRKLLIPPALGYGKRGAAPDIPSNSVLIFEVELRSVN